MAPSTLTGAVGVLSIAGRGRGGERTGDQGGVRVSFLIHGWCTCSTWRKLECNLIPAAAEKMLGCVKTSRTRFSLLLLFALLALVHNTVAYGHWLPQKLVEHPKKWLVDTTTPRSSRRASHIDELAAKQAVHIQAAPGVLDRLFQQDSKDRGRLFSLFFWGGPLIVLVFLLISL